jgi:hypothetical protein
MIIIGSNALTVSDGAIPVTTTGHPLFGAEAQQPRSIQPSTDLKRGTQLSRCGRLVNVERSRRPGDEDASCEENSVARAGRFVGDGYHDRCRHRGRWLVTAQHGKAEGESTLWHGLAACGVPGRDKVPADLVGRVALKYAELHACGQVCVFEQRQMISITVRKQTRPGRPAHL